MEPHRSTPSDKSKNETCQDVELPPGNSDRDASAACNGGVLHNQDMFEEMKKDQKNEAEKPANAGNFEAEESKDSSTAAAKKAEPKSKGRQSK